MQYPQEKLATVGAKYTEGVKGIQGAKCTKGAEGTTQMFQSENLKQR